MLYGKRADGQANRSIYLGAAIVIAAIMFAGFARNYYLRTWLGTRAITFMVHVHGLIMTAWIALFIIQTLLVAKHRVGLHRKLGLFGAGLASLLFGVGIFTIARSIERQHPQASRRLFAELFVAFDGISLIVFFCLVMAALINRHRRELHKRLMLVAMISLLPPAFGRLVAYFTHHDVALIVLGLMYASIVTCLLLDGLRHGRIHMGLAASGLIVIAINHLTYFAQTHTD